MIRPMTIADIPAGMALKQAAGWNQTEADWRMLLDLAPETCWVEELEGQVVGSSTAVCYGRQLAWVGMVLVLPDFRRRGVGRRLLLHAIESCDRLGVERLALDATEMGRPLYLSLGFVDEEPIERWGREPDRAAAGTSSRGALSSASIDLDQQVFGFDRSGLLRRLGALPGAETVEDESGFAMTRPGANARYLGPVVARDAASAERLCRAVIAPRRSEALFFDILPERPGFSELAKNLGFRPLRRLVRMSRPAGLPSAGRDWICSAAGFELG